MRVCRAVVVVSRWVVVVVMVVLGVGFVGGFAVEEEEIYICEDEVVYCEKLSNYCGCQVGGFMLSRGIYVVGSCLSVCLETGAWFPVYLTMYYLCSFA